VPESVIDVIHKFGKATVKSCADKVLAGWHGQGAEHARRKCPREYLPGLIAIQAA
jgi:hypothetical protein